MSKSQNTPVYSVGSAVAPPLVRRYSRITKRSSAGMANVMLVCSTCSGFGTAWPASLNTDWKVWSEPTAPRSFTRPFGAEVTCHSKSRTVPVPL